MIAEDAGDAVVVSHDGVAIARYVHVVDAPTFEAPKPYLHPLRTLAGDIVTGFRPHDHRWHKGLQLTCTDLSGTNLWGGHTWDGTRYAALDDLGRMTGVGDVELGTAGSGATVDHRLTWSAADGRELVREERSLTFDVVPHADRVWRLDWRSRLTNATSETLTFGSPATRGHRGSGYSGLTWRAPRSFIGGRVLSPDGETTAEEARGSRHVWLGFCGEQDEIDRWSTVVFEQIQGDGRFETRWFVRSEEFPTVNPSWAYDRTFELTPGETMAVGYRIIVADGAWTAPGIETLRRQP